LKLQNMVVPVALITWLTIVVAALSYSPAQDEEEYGEIKGVIIPNEIRGYVYILTGGEIIATVQSDPKTGEFIVPELAGGTYTFEFRPVSQDYLPEEILDVRVRVDESTDLDTLNLKPADNK